MPFLTENSRQEERTYLFSLDWIMMTLMSVIGSYAGGAMPDMFNAALKLSTGAETGSATGYRITLVISIALALAAAVPMLLMKENKAIQRQKVSTLLSLKNIKSPSTIIKFMIPTGIIGFGAGFIVPLFSIFFKLKFVATSEQVGTVFALGNVTLGIFTFVAPMLSNKLGKVKAVVICQFLSMPFIMLVTLAPNLALATSAFLIRGALMNMAGPISSALQMEMVAGCERATTSGLMVMADNIPRAITASIAGEMMTLSDFYTPFLFTTATYFVASSLYFVFFRKAESDSMRASS
jgi:MFS family permease